MYKTKKASYLPNRPNDFQDINNLANTVLFNCFRASVKWRRRKENKGGNRGTTLERWRRRTQSPRVHPAEGKDFIEYFVFI